MVLFRPQPSSWLVTGERFGCDHYGCPVRTTSSESSSFVAGLDGLRALAVVSVLAFHSRFDAASGGFLGVSLFFTLSGFLITQLLLRERHETGQTDVVAFWIRRLRRLMPGAVLLVVAVAIAASVFDQFPSTHLRGDLLAALAYVANWRFMSGSASYADLFTSTPSPVLHFWSLAIEEQFYVFFPLVMAGLLMLRRSWVVPVALGTLFSTSVLSGLLSSSNDVVYYGSHTRAAEILAGSLLALWLPLGGFQQGFVPTAPRLLSSRVGNSFVFGGVLVAFGALVVTVETSDGWLYSGGFAAMSMLSVLLIVGVQSPGVIRWLAELPIAVWIGGLSYGLYLFHWPIFLLITEGSTPLQGWSLHAVRLAVTVLVSWVSARILEQPIRRRSILRTRRGSAIALIVAIAVAVTAVVFAPRTPAQVLAGLDAPDGFVTFGENIESNLRVLVVGSEQSVVDLVRSALDGKYRLDIIEVIDPLCPIGRTPACGDTIVRTLESVRINRPDLVVFAVGVLDREAVRPSLVPVTSTTAATSTTSTTPNVVEDAAFFEATRAYVDRISDSLMSTPRILVDFGPTDAMTAFMEDAALRSTSVSALFAPDEAGLLSEVRAIMSMAVGADTRERVMVIGDSTSYGISVVVDRLEGERISVLWAGGQNCPLVEVAAVKWWEGVEFDLERCPSLDAEWRAALDSFRPSLILIAVSVPEQADQRYPGDPLWHEPGSEEYVRVHDEFIGRFMSEIQSRSIDVMILDSPTIHGGALGDAPFSSPERVGIWNAVIARWVELWPDLVVVPWARAMTVFEPTPGALRGDGVHLSQEDLEVLVARALIPLVNQRLFAGGSAVETETESIEGP